MGFDAMADIAEKIQILEALASYLIVGEGEQFVARHIRRRNLPHSPMQSVQNI
jgi:hypothetical protein